MDHRHIAPSTMNQALTKIQSLEDQLKSARRKVGKELIDWFTKNHNQSAAGNPYIPLAIARSNIRRICGLEGENE